MGNTGRHISSQGVGRDKMITMAFVRQVKNFINNFDVTGGRMHFDGVRARLTVDGGGGGVAIKDNFAVTTSKDSEGVYTALVGDGYVTVHELWDEGAPSTTGTYPGTNIKYWGNSGGVEKVIIPPFTYPSNPERVQGSPNATGANATITYGDGFENATSGRTDPLTLTDKQTLQIYLEVTTLGPCPSTESQPDALVFDVITGLKFICEQAATVYKQTTSELVELPGEPDTQITKKYILIAQVGATESATDPGVFSYNVNQLQRAPIDISAFRENAKGGLPDGETAGDMLYWTGEVWDLVPVGTSGQHLYLDVITGLPAYRNTPFIIYKSTAGALKIKVAAGLVFALTSSDNVTAAAGTVADITLTDNTTNYIELVIDLAAAAFPSGFMYWQVNAATVGSVTTPTAETGDLPVDATGKRVIRLGTVVTLTGAISSINQYVDGNVFSTWQENSLPLSALGDMFYSDAASKVLVLEAGDVDDVLVIGPAAIPAYETPSDCT